MDICNSAADLITVVASFIFLLKLVHSLHLFGLIQTSRLSRTHHPTTFPSDVLCVCLHFYHLAGLHPVRSTKYRTLIRSQNSVLYKLSFD